MQFTIGKQITYTIPAHSMPRYGYYSPETQHTGIVLAQYAGTLKVSFSDIGTLFVAADLCSQSA